MSEQYDKWIESQGDAFGRCAEITTAMVAAFPELRRVRGHYLCMICGPREHWWCVAPDGTIVDPTASQFPSKGGGEYIAHVEGTEEPTGKCHECGEYCYRGKDFCCDAHERSYMAYLMSSVRL